ncbi:MAG: sigma-70 family RNA polymerase sigma factor [Thermoguttaceae bacterium]|nr:sigma-70 family RNA polymerase sigma factor [Thermoguttaceae bacterium]
MEEEQLIQKTALGNAIEQNRDRLLAIISCRASDRLKRLMSIEDILQEAFLEAYKRLDFLNDKPEISLLVKLRKIVLQTIVDKERYFGADKRTSGKEVYDNMDDSQTNLLNRLADSITSPSKKIMRKERAVIVQQIIDELSPQYRDIILMRHFEQLDYNDCAAILNISIDAVKMRYYRALKRLKELIEQYSELQS